MKKSLLRAAAAALAATLLLAACGGGGEGGVNAGPDGPTPERMIQPGALGASSQFAGVCTVAGQKSFVRAYLDEVYLWYNELPQLDPASYAGPIDYFSALTNLPKDRFSTALPSGLAEDLAQSFASTAQSNHTSYVPTARVQTDADGRRIGYIRFIDHEIGAQDDLITAFSQVRDAGAQHLVLDLRSNSGGFLYIAQTAASMIVGPSASGRVFEQLRYNDKRPGLSASSTLNFSSTVQSGESQYPAGTPLPQLGLQRVYVLTSGATCSSSESIINGLRGIDVEVVLVGSQTCGKPYGFHRKDNCGVAYFPIEFEGPNAKGVGDYVNGFAPTCSVADNTSVAAGSAQDPLLNAALFHIGNGTCPSAPAAARSDGAAEVPAAQPGRPAWAGRLLLGSQR